MSTENDHIKWWLGEFRCYPNTFPSGFKNAVENIDQIISSRLDKAYLDNKQEVASALKELLEEVRAL